VTEDELIAAINHLLNSGEESKDQGHHAIRRIFLGIGDDAALWQPSRSHRSVISTDMLVEGVDFTREMMSLEDAGWRAMAANLSDLAAMGARPVLATVALGIAPADTTVQVLELYRGLATCAKKYKLAIVGGDLSRAQTLAIAVTVVGEVRPSNAKTRAGARPGDVLAVTGALGAARAGLTLTRRRVRISQEFSDEALRALRRPQPRLAEGRYLGASRNVTAMMDLSDGLSTDLYRLAAASGCGAALEDIPVAHSAEALARASGEDPQRFALAGGEDFELLVAIRPRAFPYLAKRFEGRFKRRLFKVGNLSEGSAINWRGSRLEQTGWDHFAR
jgi:thiamine-monophosphate kinase